MAKDPRKRQKQQERKAAKRKSKQQQLVRAKNTSAADRLAAAVKYPVLHSWVSASLWNTGMGWACLSRESPNGAIAIATFLIDRYCLGIKDAWCDVVSRFEYEDRVRRMGRKLDMQDMPPAGVRKLVESAVAYAESLGLHPHADYDKARGIFGDIDASAYPQEFEFGKNGKPFFVAGPYDTPERCARILSTLEERLGINGFHYMMPLDTDGPRLKSLRPENIHVIGAESEESSDPEAIEDESTVE